MKRFYPEGYVSKGVSTGPKFFTRAYLESAMVTGEILQSTALMCDNEHNLRVDLGCMKAIIYRNEGAIGIADGSVRDIALISRVGKTVCFTVDAIDDSGDEPIALLSRRRAQQMCNNEYISSLSAGDVICAKVTHLESFGAFCDIGCGIIALLPIDAVSVSRISHPSDRLCVGKNIRAVIRQIDQNGRITLSLKELFGTWEENAALFSQGQTVSGIVRSIEDYGVFIELTPNLAGLAEPREDIWVGQQATVYIKSIIPEKMKIKLIIIDNFESNYSTELKYFVSADKIKRWQYSPNGCAKQIVSEF